MEDSEKLIEQLSYWLDYINDENKTIEIQSSQEFQPILKLLQKVNKKRINDLLKGMNTEQDRESLNTTIEVTYAIDDIANIFRDYSRKEIYKMFTLKNLQAMYYAIYGEKPTSSKDKNYLVNIISQYYGMSNWAKAFVDK